LLTKESGSFGKSLKIATDAQKAFGLSATEALEGVTDITARLAPLGTSVEDIRTVFFGFNTAAKLAGASAIESSNAFRQLAQALGSGRLAGDEFRSVSEQVPTVLAPIAAELGVTIGELKKLAAEGKLTSEVVLRALGKVGNEGSGFLQQLLANDPTQVFKNFSNATEDLSRAFGDQLRPVVEDVTKLLTELIIKTTELVNSPIGQTAFIFAAIATAAKGVAVAIPLVTAGLIKLAAAGGLATVALNALPFVAIIGLIGGFTTALIAAKREQDNFNKALKEGDEQLLKSQFNKLFIERQKLLKRLATAQENNNKRAIASLERQLQINKEMIDPIKEKLEEERKITAEIEKQNEKKKEQEEIDKKNQEAAEKLKQKMTEIGEEIENSIKNNLRDAITGAQSFGEAMANVLNRIRDKIIEAQIEKLIGGFGEAFGAAASGGERKGLGGILGGILGGLFANGGQPPVNKISVVGERGPELFVPRSAGTIIPNNQIGGESVTNNIVVNVDATGTAVQGDDVNANQFGEQLAAAIQAEIITQKRTGGLLS
jgi:tape measure domain-containing protein